MSHEKKFIGVRIEGRVQGVGFRQWACEAARARELAGWVRNEADGSVRAVFAGPEGEVDAMLADCREGPRAASVESVEIDGALDRRDAAAITTPFSVRR